jgi:hypothetical protein
LICYSTVLIRNIPFVYKAYVAMLLEEAAIFVVTKTTFYKEDFYLILIGCSLQIPPCESNDYEYATWNENPCVPMKTNNMFVF